jgi:hypothetical protein
LEVLDGEMLGDSYFQTKNKNESGIPITTLEELPTDAEVEMAVKTLSQISKIPL